MDKKYAWNGKQLPVYDEAGIADIDDSIIDNTKKEKPKKTVGQSIIQFGAGITDKFNRNRSQSVGGYADAYNYDFGDAGSDSYQFKTGNNGIKGSFNALFGGAQGDVLYKKYRQQINSLTDAGDFNSINDMAHMLLQKMDSVPAFKGRVKFFIKDSKVQFTIDGRDPFADTSIEKQNIIDPQFLSFVSSFSKNLPEYKALQVILKGGSNPFSAAVNKSAISKSVINSQNNEFEQKKLFGVTDDDMQRKLINYDSYISNKGSSTRIAQAVANDIAGALYMYCQDNSNEQAQLLYDKCYDYISRFAKKKDPAFNSVFTVSFYNALNNLSTNKGVKSPEWLEQLQQAQAYISKIDYSAMSAVAKGYIDKDKESHDFTNFNKALKDIKVKGGSK